MIRYDKYLLFTLSALAYLVGCTPAPPVDPALHEDASYYDLSTPEIVLQDPNLEPVSFSQENTTDSDIWEVVQHNEDGSTLVDVYVVDYREETRAQVVIDGSGKSWDETYSVFVPMEEIHRVTVPAGVDVEDYIGERYSPIDGPFGTPQPMDSVPEAPVEEDSA